MNYRTLGTVVKGMVAQVVVSLILLRRRKVDRRKEFIGEL